MPFTIITVVQSLAAAALASGTSINVTVDDLWGDQYSHVQPIYLPPDTWTNYSNTICQECWAKPNPGMDWNGTYHQAIWNPGDNQISVEINFNG